MIREIAVVGLGNQGEAWALNLRESGWRVRVALRPGSSTALRAGSLRFEVIPPEKLGGVPIVAMLIPDDALPLFWKEFGSVFRAGQSLIFAHGFALHYRTVPWPESLDWILVAPKGIGRAVREEYARGRGVPAVLAVENDATGRAWSVAEAVAQGIGAARAGVYRATAREEVEADLFSEQALLCGGVPALVAETYNILVRAGIRPEVAYLECVHELAFMTRLFQERGLGPTLRMASSTARFGGIEGGSRLVSGDLRRRLESLLEEIRSGRFLEKLQGEARSGFARTRRAIEELEREPIETVGRAVRAGLEKGNTP